MTHGQLKYIKRVAQDIIDECDLSNPSDDTITDCADDIIDVVLNGLLEE